MSFRRIVGFFFNVLFPFFIVCSRPFWTFSVAWSSTCRRVCRTTTNSSVILWPTTEIWCRSTTLPQPRTRLQIPRKTAKLRGSPPTGSGRAFAKEEWFLPADEAGPMETWAAFGWIKVPFNNSGCFNCFRHTNNTLSSSTFWIVSWSCTNVCQYFKLPQIGGIFF